MLLRKIFENLHVVMAILVIFEKFSGTFCSNVLTLLTLECFAKYDAFCSYSFDYAVDYACLRRKNYRYRRGSKLWKNSINHIKNIFENGWWEDAYPSSYPRGSVLGHKLQKPYIFQSLGPLILFFFTKRRRQNGGAMAQWPPPKYAPAASNEFFCLFFYHHSATPSRITR